MTSLFKEHTFVGFVDHNTALVQYQTKLFVVDIAEVTSDLFYQLYLKGFSNFGYIRLSTPLPLEELLKLALEEEANNQPEVKNFDAEAILKVEWEEEKDCFHSFGRELGLFYACESPTFDECYDAPECQHSQCTEYRSQVEHVVFKALRQWFFAPKELAKRQAVIQIADLPELYKVFERQSSPTAMGSFVHVDHILVAEFDIDRGAQLTLQYPYETGTDPHFLAELMLPDGAHLREEDWTMFFLNQRSPSNNDAIPTVQRQRRGQDNTASTTNSKLVLDAHGYTFQQGNWRTISSKPRVNISLDDTQITIWNGLMTQKLSEISVLSNAEYRQIEPLCLCIFFEGNILAFRFENEDDEILLLNHLDSSLYLYRKFTEDLALPPAPPSENGGNPLLYVQNLVRTKQVPGARRGARVKAIAVASRHRWVYVFKPALLVAMEQFFATEDETVIAELFDSINSMDISLMPRLTMTERNILRASEDRNMFDEKFLEMEERSFYRSTGGGLRNSGSQSSFSSINKDRHFYETKLEYAGIRMPIRIPLAVFPEEIGD
ncbi:hypothetical protein HDU67_001812, partial [Dinochytrium kinnereticum]